MAFRDYMNRALAEWDRPGPEVAVSPFRPGEVNGEGIALKSLASLIAGRRAATAARAKRVGDEQDARYKALLTQQLEQRLNTPAEPRFNVDIDGQQVPLNPGQFATYSRATTPKRVPVSGALTPAISKLTTYDPETNTADPAEISQVERDLVRAAVEDRFGKSLALRRDAFDFRKGQATTGEGRRAEEAHLKYLHARENELAADEERIAKDAEARGLQYANQWVQTLLDPNASEQNKAKAAKALGVPIATNDRGKPLPGPKGRTLYVLDGLPQRAKDYAAKFSKYKRAEAMSMHAADRTWLTQERARFAGQPNQGTQGMTDENDPVLRGLNQLWKLYAPQETTEEDDLQTIPDDKPIED